MDRFTGLLGVLVILGLSYALSSNRRMIQWRIVFGGLGLQLLLAILLMKTPGVVDAFDQIAKAFTQLLLFAESGSRFLFGSLGTSQANEFIFAFRVLPVIIFFSALMSVLYHLGVMQKIIAGMSWLLVKTLGVSGVEGLCAAANVFVGQTEAPLCIKPYIPSMTRSQLMIVMTTGFATIAGSVMLGYVAMLGGDHSEQQALFAKHLLTASLMSAPGAFVIAKLMIPEDQTNLQTQGHQNIPKPNTVNVLDAAAAGTTDGLKLALNVGAMLIGFVALIAMLNWPLKAWISPWMMNSSAGAVITQITGITELSLESILGICLCPFAWLMGVATEDAIHIGSLLGLQVIATEFLAYMRLGELLQAGHITAQSAAIATYALCGFANLPSVAIQVGGLAAIAPERRQDFAQLGLKAMSAGAMACWMNASIASMFLK